MSTPANITNLVNQAAPATESSTRVSGAFNAFRARNPQTGGGTRYRITAIPEAAHIPLAFYTYDSEDDLMTTFQTLVYLLQTDEEPEQVCATYLSILRLFFPEMLSDIKAHFKQRGYRLMVIKLPSEAAQYDIELHESGLNYQQALVLLGQYIYCLYKNFTQANFTNYMTARTRAMTSLVGIMMGDSMLVALTLQKAEIIRTMVGNNRAIRVSVLEHILELANREAPVGNVFAYIKGILEWTEMNGFVLVNDVLLSTRSPALSDPSVLNEVKNLAEVVRIIASDTQPQYWRIRATPSEYHLLDRARFPTLIDMSIDIRKVDHPNLGHFAAPERTNRERVLTRLLNLHQGATRSQTTRDTYDSLRYLLEGE